MARNMPTVRDDFLHVPPRASENTSVITLGSAAWYTWIEHSRSFRFETAHSTFTARKEQRPGGWYWYAYRRRHGTLRIAYLGKSEELTSERLHTVATVLARAEDSSKETGHQPHQNSFGASLQIHQASIVPFPTALSVAVPLPQVKPVPRHNLPIQLTSLVGREPAIATAAGLLRRPDVRLLSMIGAGGIGKTRLAIEVATGLLEDFTDGISFIALAPLRDPDMVLPTIAHTLGLKESGSEAITDRLHTYLHDKHLLLVLDNFEHLMPAALVVGELLTTCPKLKLLVTSREVLHLRAEQQFSVPPLALPDRKHDANVDSLPQYPALDLFVQRARAAKPDFQVKEANAHSLAAICARLDGLPLAIELAAARIKFLSPEALLARLDHRLQLLTSGARDLPERQQTLRNTIEWSYELLNAEEQALLRRLSLFMGGCSLEAIEAVCTALGDGTEPVLERVASLADKSLLHFGTGGSEEPRLQMLETIREYGLEVLSASGERDVTHQAHAQYYLTLVETAEPEFWGPQQAVWFNRLEQERDNLRTALNWLIEGADGGKHVEMALRLGAALWWFWFRRWHFTEGAALMERALARAHPQVSVLIRARALRCAGHLVDAQGDAERGEALLAESVALFTESGDQVERGRTYFPFGMIAAGRGELATARSRYEEGLAIAREAGDPLGIANLLHGSGNVTRLQGEFPKAYALFEESAVLFREIGNKAALGSSRLRLAQLMFARGEHRKALALAEEALARNRELDDKGNIVETLDLLGQLALQQGQLAQARGYLEESLQIWTDLTDKAGSATSLSLLAQVAATERDQSAQGHAETSLELAIDEGQDQAELNFTTARSLTSLTRREYEVLRFLTRGLTNLQIAEQLVVSLPTVNTHVRSIYNKLAVTSRSAATRYAIEHHLV